MSAIPPRKPSHHSQLFTPQSSPPRSFPEAASCWPRLPLWMWIGGFLAAARLYITLGELFEEKLKVNRGEYRNNPENWEVNPAKGAKEEIVI